MTGLVVIAVFVLWCIAVWGDGSVPRDKNGRPDR